MPVSELGWLAVGFVAQACYGARFLIQWIASERAGRSLIPIHFWYLSVIGEVLLLAYAVHRRDPVIAAGQLAGLAIYLRNIEFVYRHRNQKGFGGWFRPWLLLALAAGVAGYAGAPEAAARALRVDSFWTLFGFIGQLLFTSRFIVQWIFSERARRSVTPVHFWYLSIVGSLMLLAYAIAVADPVIIVGQAFGSLVYTRNLALMRRERAARVKPAMEQRSGTSV
jgi:lipid-A-disaccharide synthase-like uncharacterized protein